MSEIAKISLQQHRALPWRPPAEVTDLMGRPLPSACLFFVQPPPEIGSILHAWSTLRFHHAPLPAWLKATLSFLIIGSIGAAVLTMPAYARLREDQIDLARVIGIVVVLIAFATAKMAAGATPDCFFVAKNGIALARYGSARTRHLLFNNAAELRVKQKRCFIHGIYTGTNFDFSWYGPDGHPILRLHDTYYSSKPNSSLSFAYAAETAWTFHYLCRADAELEDRGFAEFQIRRSLVVNELIRVYRNSIELLVKTGNSVGEVRITRDEIFQLAISNGLLEIQHIDGTWNHGTGSLSIPLTAAANAKSLVMLLQKCFADKF